MGKLMLQQPFPARLTRTSYALISVVDPEGRPKILTVKPGGEKSNWLQIEWARDNGGRARQLVSVQLTSEREYAGALLLKEAYEAEGFTEGWKAWESYLASQYYIDGDSRQRRQRPVYRGHFPTELLPKRVQEMQATAHITKKGPRWEPPKGLEHPDDKKVDDKKATG